MLYDVTAFILKYFNANDKSYFNINRLNIMLFFIERKYIKENFTRLFPELQWEYGYKTLNRSPLQNALSKNTNLFSISKKNCNSYQRRLTSFYLVDFSYNPNIDQNMEKIILHIINQLKDLSVLDLNKILKISLPKEKIKTYCKKKIDIIDLLL